MKVHWCNRKLDGKLKHVAVASAVSGKVVAFSIVPKAKHGDLGKLRSVESILSQLKEPVGTLTIQGTKLFENPVTELFAQHHGLELEYEEKPDKAILKKSWEARGELPGSSKPISSFKFPLNIATARVRWDGHAEVGKAFYYLGKEYLRDQVTVLDQGSELHFYHHNQLMLNQKKIPKGEISGNSEGKELWIQECKAGSYSRKKAREVGLLFDNLILKILQTGRGIIPSDVPRLLGLKKSWPWFKLESAAGLCRKAYRYNFQYFYSCLEVGIE